MSARPLPEPQTLAQLPPKVLEEVMRQLRSSRNDIIRYGVWNIRNLTDEEFNRTDDRKLLGYFRQDLLETRFLSKGRASFPRAGASTSCSSGTGSTTRCPERSRCSWTPRKCF
jgi:hypothetical protein